MRSIELMVSIPPEERRYPRSSAFPHPIHGTLEILRRRTAFGLKHLQERQFGVELGGGTELRQLIREDAMRAHFCPNDAFLCGQTVVAASEKTLKRTDECSRLPGIPRAFPGLSYQRARSIDVPNNAASVGGCRPGATGGEHCRIARRGHSMRGLRTRWPLRQVQRATARGLAASAMLDRRRRVAYIQYILPGCCGFCGITV